MFLQCSEQCQILQRKLDRYMIKMNFYSISDCLVEARKNKWLKRLLLQLGYKVYMGPLSRDKRSKRVYVKSLDDFHPSFRDGMVSVTFHEGDKRISVWGDDDFGMEKNDCSRELYEKLISEVISVEKLKALGFINA